MLVGALVWEQGVAIAAEPPAQPTVTLNPPSGYSNGWMNITGTGFAPNDNVKLLFDDQQIGSGTISPWTGGVSFGAPIPKGTTFGAHRISIVGSATPADAAFATFTLRPTAWVQAGFSDSHAGFNPNESLLDGQSVGSLARRCAAQASASVATSSPAVVGGRMYVGTTFGDLLAFSTDACARAWSVNVGPGAASSPAVVSGVAYVATSRGGIAAYKATTGALLWRTNVSPGFSTPTVSHGRIIASGRDGNVYAFKSSDGTLLWSEAVGAGVESPPSYTAVMGVLYVGSADGTVYALDPSTGKVNEARSMPVGGPVSAPPAIRSGRLFVATENGIVTASDNYGVKKWSTQVGGVTTPLATDGTRVYVDVAGAGLRALSVKSGSVVWRSAVGAGESSPVVANGLVYLAESTHVGALDAATGESRWTASLSGSALSGAVVAEGRVYAGSDDGALTVFGLPNS
ncbi:MAG TPA: PQQ-binding-like beta-propeller repeat protein [Thermoleophilaceae bacterium]|jgi:outer membrane protein assembly factor BamB|nr:PQQ-binding-like beta-propeller repeat protein [Thermoleophilaceae bacterium]